MKFTVIIPARISSTRFPGKILHDIKGLPMIEHVRRRALLGKNVNEVFVATCDQEIKSVVQKSGGKVLMTSNTHKNGTQRASEAAKKIKSDYVILLQGDEPCILPSTIDDLIEKIQKDKGEFYNAICPIKQKSTLYDKSSVKCALDSKMIVQNCFRISPYSTPYSKQKLFIFKMLGLMAFEINFLKKFHLVPNSSLSVSESIEQLDILYHKTTINPFIIKTDFPSVNFKRDLFDVDQEFNKQKQSKLLFKTLQM